MACNMIKLSSRSWMPSLDAPDSHGGWRMVTVRTASPIASMAVAATCSSTLMTNVSQSILVGGSASEGGGLMMRHGADRQAFTASGGFSRDTKSKIGSGECRNGVKSSSSTETSSTSSSTSLSCAVKRLHLRDRPAPMALSAPLCFREPGRTGSKSHVVSELVLGRT